MGGTLIDGYGGRPLRNSVVLIEGERITAVGQVGSLAVPTGAEVIDRGDERAAQACGTCTSIS